MHQKWGCSQTICVWYISSCLVNFGQTDIFFRPCGAKHQYEIDNLNKLIVATMYFVVFSQQCRVFNEAQCVSNDRILSVAIYFDVQYNAVNGYTLLMHKFIPKKLTLYKFNISEIFFVKIPSKIRLMMDTEYHTTLMVYLSIMLVLLFLNRLMFSSLD